MEALIVIVIIIAAYVFALCTLENDEQILWSLRFTGWLIVFFGGGYIALGLVTVFVMLVIGYDPTQFRP